jgi:hypothetical protein
MRRAVLLRAGAVQGKANADRSANAEASRVSRPYCLTGFAAHLAASCVLVREYDALTRAASRFA